MFFRFGSAVVLVVLISLAGIALEKQNLQLRRDVSRQYYRTDVLLESHAKLRLETQELGAPVRLFDSLKKGKLKPHQAEQPAEADQPQMPLLRWQRSTPFPREP